MHSRSHHLISIRPFDVCVEKMYKKYLDCKLLQNFSVFLSILLDTIFTLPFAVLWLYESSIKGSLLVTHRSEVLFSCCCMIESKVVLLYRKSLVSALF